MTLYSSDKATTSAPPPKTPYQQTIEAIEEADNMDTTLIETITALQLQVTTLKQRVTELSLDYNRVSGQYLKLQQAYRRIPVTERLPEHENPVIVWNENGYADFATYADFKWWDASGNPYDEYDDAAIASWCDLPPE